MHQMVVFPKPEKHPFTLMLTQQEIDVIKSLSAEQALTESGVMRQALKLYQLCHERHKQGETMSFSGDRDRRIDFAGLAFEE